MTTTELHIRVRRDTIQEVADLARLYEEEFGFHLSANQIVQNAIHDMWVRRVKAPTDNAVLYNQNARTGLVPA